MTRNLVSQDTYLLGSVSFKFGDLKEAKQAKVWVTVFDSLNDDLYDGDFTEDDDETPRILIEFSQLAAPKAVVTPKEEAKAKHNLKQPTARTNTGSINASRPSTTATKRQVEPPKKKIDLAPQPKRTQSKQNAGNELGNLENEIKKYNTDSHLGELSELVAT